MSALEVLWDDNHVLAVVKPGGLPCVPDESGDPSLLEACKAWVAERYGKPGAVFLGVVHRLDRPVSGVMLFARTSKSASRLSAAFRERRVEKVYLGVVEGELEGAGRLELFLRKDEERRRVQVFEEERPGTQAAVTDYRVLGRARGRSLVELKPLTGRKHQLRASVAFLGAPLAGDLKYGAREALPDRTIALHARALTAPHPTREEPVVVASEPPPTAIWRWG